MTFIYVTVCDGCNARIEAWPDSETVISRWLEIKTLSGGRSAHYCPACASDHLPDAILKRIEGYDY